MAQLRLQRSPTEAVAQSTQAAVLAAPFVARRATTPGARRKGCGLLAGNNQGPVSYTHLTLPTIC
eukprot:1751033-Alexandrium_andersonii.AAC.1